MIKIFLASLLSLFLSSCSNPALFKETRLTMDTFAEISVYNKDKVQALKAIESAFKETERIEKAFSRFDPESEVSMVNRLAGEQEVNISVELFKMLEDSIYYSEMSGDSFDITVMPLAKGRYKYISLNKDRLSVRFLEPDLKIDLGGIAKGYAVDRVKDTLISNGIENALINIGGNIYAMGDARGRTGWTIGIQDPRNKDKISHKLTIKNKGVSTSGNYERGQHIIDPATGSPALDIMSVTVIADSAEKADALSTAVFVMGEEKAREFIKQLKEDTEVFILDNKGVFIKYP